MDKEIWKDIPGYEGLYQVSNYGRVKSLKRKQYDINNKKTFFQNKEIILKQNECKKGYLSVKLQKDKIKKTIKVHRLVLKAFCPNKDDVKSLPGENICLLKEEDLQVNHKDTNKKNNNLNNLEYCTNAYNHKHAIENGIYKERKIILISENNKKYIFENIHKAFKFLNKRVSGHYCKYINKNKLYQGYYWYDLKEE